MTEKKEEDNQQRNLKNLKIFLWILLGAVVIIAVYNYIKKQNRKKQFTDELFDLDEKERILKNLDTWQQKELKLIKDFNNNLPLYIRIVLGICLIIFDVVIFHISNRQHTNTFSEITSTLKEVATWNATIFSLFIFVSFITHGTIRNTEKTIEIINDKLRDWVFIVYFKKVENKKITLIDNIDFNSKDLKIIHERKEKIKYELKKLE